MRKDWLTAKICAMPFSQAVNQLDLAVQRYKLTQTIKRILFRKVTKEIAQKHNLLAQHDHGNH
jgi:hypothetical protein